MSIIAHITLVGTSVSGTKTYGTLVIMLTDAATGSPVNGNGIAVDYELNLNGSITTGTIYMLGQQINLYTGEIADSNTLSSYFVKYYATVNTTKKPLPPLPLSCDLKINTILVDSSESSVGASDAQITVNATSSYLPIQYSIDNVHFQSSPTFTGLPGGLITVYCTDANDGCAANSSTTIPTTANLLIGDPTVTINGSTSRWNAAFNPIIFTYQRRDFEVTAALIDTATGKLRLSVNADLSPLTAQLRAQPNSAIYVYVNAAPYISTYKVVSADNGSIVLDTPHNNGSDPVTGFININLLRPYYKIYTYITYFDRITGAQSTIMATNRPDNQGVIRADISNFLQSILSAKDNSTYTAANFRDTNLSACYSIQYAENYDDGTLDGKTSGIITIAEPYYVTYTARQLRSPNGGNMAQYVPFPASTTPAKWLTDFAEPAYSNGYPFDLSFIYSETLVGRQLYYKIALLDINRQPLPGGDITSYLLNEDGSWLLNQDTSKLVISRQTSSSAAIPQQIGINRLLVSMDMPLEAWYFNIAVYYNDDDSNPIQVMETQTVRIDHAPDINAVYMRWIGLTGSWNYYRFNYNQEISLDVQNATIIKNYVQDWQNQEGIEEVISKDAGQKIKLMAEDLSVADIKGLQSIKYSPKVQILLNANPVQWQTVILNTATFSEYDTINGQAPFSITFNQPSINIQTQ
jgi:hypothetical protein